VYFTDRGLEELEKRRGDEEVTLAWVAERLADENTHPWGNGVAMSNRCFFRKGAAD